LQVSRLGAGLALRPGLEQSLAQVLELLVLWMQRLKIDIGLGRIGDLGQYDLRIVEGRPHVDILELVGIGPAATRVTRVFQDREIKLDLTQSLLIHRIRKIAGRRQIESGARKPPIIGLSDFIDGGLRLAREAHIRHPHWLTASVVEGFKRCEILGGGVRPERGIGKLGADGSDHRRGRGRDGNGLNRGGGRLARGRLTGIVGRSGRRRGRIGGSQCGGIRACGLLVDGGGAAGVRVVGLCCGGRALRENRRADHSPEQENRSSRGKGGYQRPSTHLLNSRIPNP
jgi:hypothetical protein